VNLSLAVLVKHIKEEPLKDLIEHTDNSDQTEVVCVTPFLRILS
jgi:hypothetical protein